MSEPPALVSGPPPKSTVAGNQPVVTTLPLPSIVTAFPDSFAEPPKRRAQTTAPLPPRLCGDCVGSPVPCSFVGPQKWPNPTPPPPAAACLPRKPSSSPAFG